ncbi:hypothetical protein F383_36654 [Gossypium arboreum]|uniref:Uncharacterized protein n=1 Tax=Gossypium arboreum TaxID=29729 RepID=A0A0B0MD83_GOSAR|nr:hypothetical protein F383_36654 [Gossypium arboreum]
MMPMSQTWSYTITHIGSYVMTYVSLFLRFVRGFSDVETLPIRSRKFHTQLI